MNLRHLICFGILLLAAGCRIASPSSSPEKQPDEPPNILWLTAEDMDPNLGSYGDSYAHTPNLDRLASKSVRYTNAFATAPACSPARSALITGVWPNSMGTAHLRNRTIQVPDHIKPFPKYLRRNGYYCTNNGKMDYNYDWPDDIWNESSDQAHWRNRSEPDQPFFSVFNFNVTHQHTIRRERKWGWTKREKNRIQALSGDEKHDPEHAPVPPYYPDTPAVRKDIVTHYDSITVMDQKVGTILDQLKEDGLMDETIIFFYSDHGRGMPRHKRWLYDSGLQVPLMIYFPEKYEHLAPEAEGGTSERLVSFVDFAPTMLSLLGIEVPDHMQGVPFLGESKGEPRQYVHGARDRVDEVVEVSRSVRSHRYLYIRNYLPHRPSLQYSHYSEVTPTRTELRRLAMQEKLSGAAADFMRPEKPAEELYDVTNDPYQVNNLADSQKKKHREALQRLRREHRRWSREIRDATLMPEPRMLRQARKREMTVYEWRREDRRFPHRKVFHAAELVGRNPDRETINEGLTSEHPGVRYWAATAVLASESINKSTRPLLVKKLDDPEPMVRIPAAEALAREGYNQKRAIQVLSKLLRHDQYWTRLYAGIALRYLKGKARPAVPVMKKARGNSKQWPYLKWLLQDYLDWTNGKNQLLYGFFPS